MMTGYRMPSVLDAKGTGDHVSDSMAAKAIATLMTSPNTLIGDLLTLEVARSCVRRCSGVQERGLVGERT